MMPVTRKKIFLIILFASLCGTVFSQQNNCFRLPSNVNENDYLQNTLIFKVNKDYASYCKNDNIEINKLNTVLNRYKTKSLLKKFPRISAPEKEYNAYGQKYADLSRIYEYKYMASADIETVINEILLTGCIEYAQPHYISKPLDYVPNDPLIINQYYLNTIKAFAAWETYKGDTNIVIAITDWGTDYTHPDLAGNIKYNYFDPIDGIDNDNDGYTDNYHGWDIADNDNNPIGFSSHGTLTAGIASATTDNSLGGSGCGFSCKFIPVKVSDTNYQGTMTYESIVYAVEHGCSIINCSWGSTFYSGPYGQDVIDYASVNKNALVVVACGNDNNIVPFFPASYNYVLSVASSNASDIKAGFSSFGYFVDITAPGEAIYATLMGGAYGASGGTSFSAALVSGCAAIVKSKYPTLTGVQIGEILKATSDIIDTLQENEPYLGLLGSGRINLFNAVNDTLSPSINMYNSAFTDTEGTHVLVAGDTVSITGSFINYLTPSSPALNVAIECLSDNVQLIDSLITLGAIPQMASVDNLANPFVFFIKPSVLANEELIFKLTYNDTNYTSFQYITLVVNKNYIDIDTNKISVSVTSDGMLGYNDGNSLQGLGFRYQHSETLIYTGGFIAGRSSAQVSDALYGTTEAFDKDFKIEKNICKIPSSFADYEAYGVFNDSAAGSYLMNLSISQHAYAWTNTPDDKYIIIEYTLHNLGTTTLTGVYAGLYADWDIKNSVKNRIEYHEGTRTGYCFSSEGGIYTGISLLTPGNIYHYAFDNDGTNGSIKISDGFSGQEKYTALKTTRNYAGLNNSSNDVSEMISSGPFNIQPFDSVKLVFALTAAEHLNDLLYAASSAFQKYYTADISNENLIINADALLSQNTPNPFTDKTEIQVTLYKRQNVELSYCDVKGAMNKTIFSGTLQSGVYNFIISDHLNSGIYVYTLKGQNFCIKKYMCVSK